MESNTISTPPIATEAEREMYQRYVQYFDSGTSPYGGLAPLPFFMWLKLKPQRRPGGPAISERSGRQERMMWQVGDVTWAKEVIDGH